MSKVRRSTQLRVLALLLAGMVLMPAMRLEAAQDLLPAVRRVSLDGSWTLKTGSTERLIDVPASLEPVVGIRVWTRTFNLPKSDRGRLALLRFEGISNQATVYLNGHQLGSHWGYTPFWFDVSRELVYGGKNTLRVDIDDRLLLNTVPGGASLDPKVPPEKAGPEYWGIAWLNYSGIIRPVELVLARSALVTSLRWQPHLDSGFQRASIDLAAGFYASHPGRYRINGRLEKGGRTVAVFQGPFVNAIPRKVEDISARFQVLKPELWSPDSPSLYTLKVLLDWNGTVADQRTQEVGFRTISASGGRILLNGKPIFLKGVDRHDIYPKSGFTADPSVLRSDLQEIKALGANYVRSVHYPPDPRLPELADRIGLLVSEEIPAWADFSRPDVVTKCLGMLHELITRDYDHPSIIMWLIGNAGPDGSRQLGYFQKGISFVKQQDPTRLASYVFDNSVYDQAGITGDLKMVRAAGMDVYCKNGYWNERQIDEAAKYMPRDIPTMIMEWSGGEGSDRQNLAPGGSPGFGNPQGLPLSEQGQAKGIFKRFQPWKQYLPGSNSQFRLAGLSYWDWQDVEWPSMTTIFKGHGSLLGTGLVYKDRTQKEAYRALQTIYRGM